MYIVYRGRVTVTRARRISKSNILYVRWRDEVCVCVFITAADCYDHGTRRLEFYINYKLM